MRRLLYVLMILFVTATPALAQQDKAQSAAESILKSLAAGQYRLVWDQQTSQWFRTHATEEQFLANMSMGRPQLGTLQKLSLVSMDHTNKDPVTGFEGDIYAVTFHSKYTAGEFYERVVVLKEADGVYRLAGIFGSPVPK